MGGKVPKDYEGAYEKAVPVKAIGVSDASDSKEFPESYVWPVITAKGAIKHPKLPVTPTSTRFEFFSSDMDIEYDEEDDDAEDGAADQCRSGEL